MPANERIGLDVPQNITPREHLADSRHNPPRGIVGPPRLDVSLPKQRQLLPQEQILRCECATAPKADADKANEIEQNQYHRDEAMPQSDEQTQL